MSRNETGRRIAVYERTSTKVHTVEPQDDAATGRLGDDQSATLVHRYVDTGVSGLIPLGQRPAGRGLLDDAAAGLFDEVWVTRVDRLGRSPSDVTAALDRLTELGVGLRCTMSPGRAS